MLGAQDPSWSTSDLPQSSRGCRRPYRLIDGLAADNLARCAGVDAAPLLLGETHVRRGLAGSAREVEALQHSWVSSTGGPLLAAPQSALSLWMGADSAEGPVESWGDYGRACAIDGYIGVVAVGTQHALVLGDEPAMTTYLARNGCSCGGWRRTRKTTW